LTATALLGGDVNDHIDGGLVINIGDVTLLTANFGEEVPDVAPPIELTQADINDDGAINVQDLALIGGNYEIAGCQAW
ncbi:MAG: hypothetical protein GY832_01255, partial [Chloroflexi bacterium]|nr:hypothetical protein [Chloroflexota bacterium]